MRKIAFLPVSIGGGLLAGLIAKKPFGLIWEMIDDQEPSQLVKRFVDHGFRHPLQAFDWLMARRGPIGISMIRRPLTPACRPSVRTISPFRTLSCLLPRIGVTTVSELTIDGPLSRPASELTDAVIGPLTRPSVRAVKRRSFRDQPDRYPADDALRHLDLEGHRRGDRLCFGPPGLRAGAACTRCADEDATRSAARLSGEDGSRG